MLQAHCHRITRPPPKYQIVLLARPACGPHALRFMSIFLLFGVLATRQMPQWRQKCRDFRFAGIPDRLYWLTPSGNLRHLAAAVGA